MSDSVSFCTEYVKQVFGKWDKDKSGVLERQEIKDWLREELKAKPLRKGAVKKGFYQLIQGADANGDGKLDRWELYTHCIKSYNEATDD